MFRGDKNKENDNQVWSEELNSFYWPWTAKKVFKILRFAVFHFFLSFTSRHIQNVYKKE